MLRSLLIYLSQANWMRRYVMGWKIARKVAFRFVAGESLDQAIEVVQNLNQQNLLATMDQLGEHTDTAERAVITTKDILGILEKINSSGIKSGLSVKLSQIGLLLDLVLCEDNLRQILETAKKLDIFVRIDMEDSACVEATLDLYWKMRRDYGFENVGMVIQSYLYRSKEDTADLLAEGTRIRMVKGAYREPAEVAFPKKKDVDLEFDKLTRMMLDHAVLDSSPAISDDGRWPPVTAVGSHDDIRIMKAISYAQEHEIPKEKLEIQMLYGIRRDLQKQLASQGYPVRVYVPFGTEWYPYFMRRLAERPANLWFFISSLLRK